MDDSYFLPKKCYRRYDGGVDRISELPDEIILVILSFLSLRECVTTSVLSSRWSDLWKHIPNFNLDAKLLTNNYQESIRGRAWDAGRCKYVEIVNSVLQSHKAPSLKEFRISLYANKSAQCAVAKWLEFVVSRQVERLELDLLCQDTSHVILLEDLLSVSTVCQLPQNLIGFKSLKSLCLKGFDVSGEAIDLLLCNCPLLEKLYIHSSILTSDIVVCGTALALKHLDINVCYGQPFGEKSIKVSAPNLTWLRVYTSEELVLENIPKLISAEYICALSAPDYVKQFASAVFSCVSRLQNLKLNLSYIKVFLENAFPQMPKLKKLVVTYNGAYEDSLLPLTALIRASPRLQEFRLKVVCQRKCHNTFKNGEGHPHRHLKVFEFIWFSEDAAGHIELLKYILDNCVALEKIIIGSPSLSRAGPRAARDRLEQLLNGKVPPSLSRADLRAARDRLEQLLNGKVPDHIQLYIV